MVNEKAITSKVEMRQLDWFGHIMSVNPNCKTKIKKWGYTKKRKIEEELVPKNRRDRKREGEDYSRNEASEQRSGELEEMG